MFVNGNFTATRTFSSRDIVGAAKLFFLPDDLQKIRRLAADREIDPALVDQGVITETFIDLDLVITSVDFQSSEFHSLDEHLGDTFSLEFYGKSPIILTMQGVLFDLEGNSAKKHFTRLYVDLLRLSKVAAYGVTPYFNFVGCTAQGAFLGLILSESSEAQDYITVNARLLVFNMYAMNPENRGLFTQVEIWGSGSSVPMEPYRRLSDIPANTRGVSQVVAPSRTRTTGDFNGLYGRYGDMFGVDPKLLKALAIVESTENPGLISEESAVGLMQVLCRNPDASGRCSNDFPAVKGWDRATVSRLYDPEYNVYVGSQVISDNIRKYGFQRGVAVYQRWGARTGPFIQKDLVYMDKVFKAYRGLGGVIPA